MKRVISIVLSSILCLMLVACGSDDKHIGEAKTPSGSSAMNGRDYKSVIEVFEENGFTNIKVEKIEDLITGWLTKDGEVEKVSVGGNEHYSPDKWIPADTEVVIYYHTFPNSSGSTSIVEDTENTSIEPPAEDDESISADIVMPYSSADYCGEGWTLESLITHLTNLGFTNITTVACAPDDDRYRLNIFEIIIATGWFSDDPWEAGEAFESDAEITILYNEAPLLTAENCPDLLAVLTSDEISYMNFANTYDGRYIEFDGYVVENLEYWGGTGHVINVAGGDYSTDEPSGLIIRVDEEAILGADINKNVEAGQNVKVIGIVNVSKCEYFKMLYVKGLYLKSR